MVSSGGIATYPSSQMIPTVIFLSGFARFQGTGAREVSVSHGSWSMMALWNSSKSSMDELAIGPTTPWIDSCPGQGTFIPVTGFLIAVGRSPYAPQNAAGTRIEPPISDPTPSGAHLKPIEAPSPPDEPPGVRVRLYGLSVVPVMLLLQQRCCRVVSCGLVWRGDGYH